MHGSLCCDHEGEVVTHTHPCSPEVCGIDHNIMELIIVMIIIMELL